MWTVGHQELYWAFCYGSHNPKKIPRNPQMTKSFTLMVIYTNEMTIFCSAQILAVQPCMEWITIKKNLLKQTCTTNDFNLEAAEWNEAEQSLP